jgi:hypothetical protein
MPRLAEGFKFSRSCLRQRELHKVWEHVWATVIRGTLSKLDNAKEICDPRHCARNTSQGNSLLFGWSNDALLVFLAHFSTESLDIMLNIWLLWVASIWRDEIAEAREVFRRGGERIDGNIGGSCLLLASARCYMNFKAHPSCGGSPGRSSEDKNERPRTSATLRMQSPTSLSMSSCDKNPTLRSKACKFGNTLSTSIPCYHPNFLLWRLATRGLDASSLGMQVS